MKLHVAKNDKVTVYSLALKFFSSQSLLLQQYFVNKVLSYYVPFLARVEPVTLSYKQKMGSAYFLP